MLARGVNVIAHLVARRTVNGELQLSLGSNPDVTADLLPLIAQARRAGRDIRHDRRDARADALHDGDAAQLAPEQFDFLVDDSALRLRPVRSAQSAARHASSTPSACYASALVRDGGTLQIGIGELGDALVYALLLRHQQNAAWRGALQALGTGDGDGADRRGRRQRAVRARPVRLHRDVRRLSCSSSIAPACCAAASTTAWRSSGRWQPASRKRFDESILPALLAAGVGPLLSERAVRRPQAPRRVSRGGRIRGRPAARRAAGSGSRPTSAIAASCARLAEQCLGRELRNGQVLHAGFFLGPRGFYAALRDLPESERASSACAAWATSTSCTAPTRSCASLQRRDARFINTTMMVTLLGAAVSDALEDGQVVSGVGGQYNFVAMAHALPDARSILCVRATRTHDGRTTSNIVWNYAHATIPRHLRDIVITEYGIADLRGRTDAEVIAALLNVADSRFQERVARAGQGRGQDPRRLPRSRSASATTCPQRARAGTARRPRAGLFQRLSLRHRPHRRGNHPDARPEASGGAHRLAVVARARGCCAPCGTERRRRSTRAALKRMGLHAAQRGRRASAAAPGRWALDGERRRLGVASAPRRLAAGAPGSGAARDLACRLGAHLAASGSAADLGGLLAGRAACFFVAFFVTFFATLRAGFFDGAGLAGAVGTSAPAQLIEDGRVLQRGDVLRDLLAARDRLAADGA